MSRPFAVIIGAGVAGISAAWWLARSGWRCLGRELLRLRYRDFLKDIPYLAVRRNDLIRILHDALDQNTELKFGCTLEAIQTDGRQAAITLGDGSVITANLVIGADGFRSATRRMVFGVDQSHFEHLGYRFAVYDIDDNIKLESDFLSFAEPGHLAEYYALNGGRLAAMHVWRAPEATEPPRSDDHWPMLERVSASSHPMVRQFLKDGAKGGEVPTIDSLTMVNLPA